MTEKEVLDNAFELIAAFDEVVALGYRESVNLAQIRTYTEMDSHEERVFYQIKKVFFIYIYEFFKDSKFSLDARRGGAQAGARQGQGAGEGEARHAEVRRTRARSVGDGRHLVGRRQVQPRRGDHRESQGARLHAAA